MPREINIPAETVYEDIRTIEEVPNISVNVMVGKTTSTGEFIVPQQYELYMIDGANYIELNGPPTSWAPDKPTGTFRNEDLWHFIDILRNTNA
jgi:hypothetical protein